MIVKLLTERYLEFLSLKGGCTASSESTLVKMSYCWKSRALAHIIFFRPIYCGGGCTVEFWENGVKLSTVKCLYKKMIE